MMTESDAPKYQECEHRARRVGESCPNPGASNAGRKRILIVDDTEAVRNVIRIALERFGYATTEVENGRAALRLHDRERFDLILLDMVMPDMDGLETLRDLRLIDPDVRVVAMSGGGQMDAKIYLRFASALGAPAMLLKPFSVDELAVTVESVFRRSGAGETSPGF